MKLQTLLILLLAPLSAADLPEDLVPEDALAIVSIEGGSFDSGFQQVMQAVNESEDLIAELLRMVKSVQSFVSVHFGASMVYWCKC